jgi:hypothetical protein
MPTQIDQIAAPPNEVNPQDVRVWNDDGNAQGQRQMGNVVGTLLALATRTTNTNGIALTNPNHRGLILYVAVGTPVSGTTPTLQLRVNAIDPITGAAFPIWTPAALNPPVANTEYVYGLYPSAAGESFTVFMNGILTRTWSVDVLLTGAGVSIPFSLAYSLLL